MGILRGYMEMLILEKCSIVYEDYYLVQVKGSAEIMTMSKAEIELFKKNGWVFIEE